MNKLQTNQTEENPITDIKELNKIQDELINKSDGKFIKPQKPEGANN
mgnify:FL=1